MTIRSIVAGSLIGALLVPALPVEAGERYIRCESNNGRYRECRVDTDGRVELVREFSRHRCYQWRTWGYDRRSIWVEDGCRAEFRVGRDDGGISTGGAVAIGAIAGAAILAAILAGKDKPKGSDATTAPDWMQGRFRGFNPKEDVTFTIDIARDGSVTGTANEESATGYTANGDRLFLGAAEFKVTREEWGFTARRKGDSENVIYFRRQN
jgi:hypothetical protein